jgi:CRISPR-associated protein Csx17
MEKLFAQRDLTKEPKLAAPLAGLSPRWILAADDGSLVTGRLDAGRLEDLLFGMTWISWDAAPASVAAYREASRRWAAPLRDSVMPRPYVLLKHLFLSEGIRLPGQAKIISIRAEPSVIPLLRANRISQACAVAQRRLFASGLNVLRSIFPDSAQGTALAAALLVPVRQSARLTQMILQDQTTNT